MCLVSVVEEVTRRSDLLVDTHTGGTHDGPTVGQLTDDVGPNLTKLRGFLEIVWARMSLFLTFLVVMVGAWRFLDLLIKGNRGVTDDLIFT